MTNMPSNFPKARAVDSNEKLPPVTADWLVADSERRLQLRRLALDQPLRLGNKVGQRHRALVALAARPHTHRPRPLFLIAEDQDVRHLLIGKVADLGIHLFVACIGLHAEARGLQLRFDFLPHRRYAAR